MQSRAASTARSALELVSEHRWKAVGAAVVAAVGLMMAFGVINVGKLASSLTQYATLRTGPSAGTDSASDILSAVEAVTPSSPSITTCFTPEENCTSQILAAIDGARAEILVQADSFTTRSVIDALGRARQRGVKVRVILDKADERERISGGARLISQRILPQVDAGVAIVRNKVILIDRDTVITGSFSFTEAVQKKNAENLLVIKGHPDIAAAYIKNWQRRLAASRPYYGTMAPVL
jgi:phosphatidylserine/phosphatidylglycerophosphate/cardiolipin synthase-like enzyme